MVTGFVLPAIGAFGAYVVGYVIYQLYLHPLAKVPGPKLAALTRLYEFYWDCIRPGQYSFQIKDMHDKLGPIVRIGPNEVHIRDPDWFDTLYNATAKLDKDPWFYGFMGIDESAFSTIGYKHHQMKRNKTNPFFSRANVDKSEPVLRKVTNNMFHNFDSKKEAGEPIGIRDALKSYATDVVCEFCFSKSMEFVKAPDFSATFQQGQSSFGRMLNYFRHIPGFAKMMMSTPKWVVPYMPQDAQQSMKFISFIEHHVGEVVNDDTLDAKSAAPSIVRTLYTADLPDVDRSAQVLEQEAQTFVAAGTYTTSRMLEDTIFFVSRDAEILKRVTKEVRDYLPEKTELLSQRDLENLPYLSAVIQEGLRKCPAVPSRFPRINRTETMFYKDIALPSGTVISMAPWDVLLDDKAFPNASTFDPDRWLDPDQKQSNNKYMVPFGRGSRTCVGQTLAMAELYVVLGNFFRRYDVQLYETTEKEITIVEDYFVPFPYTGSKGVRVMLS